MLLVRNLSRSYGTFKAVDDVSFSIQNGEIVGLLGHNGAGKTTIMKMLSGYLEPDRGEISVNETALTTSVKQIQATLGYLPESLPVYPEMSVADYLDYAADLKGIPPEEKAEELRRVVRQTDIAPKFLEPISTLSRGYKQRVGVAQAILGQPRLLILDEPTNGLDPTQTAQMRELIKDLAKTATVILSTHIMQEVDALCDRVLILSRGQLTVDAKLEELRESKRLLLATSLQPEQAAEKLATLEGVASLTALDQADEVFNYRIKLEESADSFQVGAAVARAVSSEQAELYQLQHEMRDLESLFRQVSDKEVSHAA